MEKDTLKEKDFQHHITNMLVKSGYVQRKSKDFNRQYAMDIDILLQFLETTQPKEMADLKRAFGADYKNTVVNCINNEIVKPERSLLDVLKNGVEINHVSLHMMYNKPASSLNPDLMQKYNQNIFSVAEEIWPSDKERVDIITFLNGLPIFAFELKCEADGQDYTDAINQWKMDRNPANRLFLDRAGCMVFFAMDTTNVFMTTKLERELTRFLPFNQGCADGPDDIDTGAGNPPREDEYATAYIWEDLLQKDSVMELIMKFMFYERNDKGKERLIFPRYHQRDAVRKILADAFANHTSQNYLVQHSAGSGKTKTIVWLAYRLASLHDADNHQIYDNVIIMTDRVNVDRQLQAAVRAIDHQAGLIKTLGDDCTSADLADALNGDTKITVTTIKKFMYITELVEKSKRTYAVIIDEAHSSTTGKEMRDVKATLLFDDSDFVSDQDMINQQLSTNGKLSNVSMFAFTATPKPTTLQLFGRPDKHGFYRAFHLYSMKQAIEEGFILDVLSNYTEYATYYKLTKVASEDPLVEQSKTRKEILRFAELQDVNIRQRIEIVVEHFREHVMSELGGKAKAMVVTASRKEAVHYRQAFDAYIKEKGYTNIKALVAFSGKVTDDDGSEYSETKMNGFAEAKTPERFDTDEYNVLLVADKYQTGFDQPKLCAMYIFKRLRGVNAVQTLSRLNRALPNKKVFVLDFVNTYDDMRNAFAPYYKTTILAKTVTVSDIWELDARITAYAIFDDDDIDAAADILFSKDGIDIKGKNKLNNIFQRTLRRYNSIPTESDKKEFAGDLRSYIRLYEFLTQASGFRNADLLKKYAVYRLFVRYIPKRTSDTGIDLKTLIAAMGFKQKKVGEHKNEPLTSKPIVKLPSAEKFVPQEEDEVELSKIIDDINSMMGTDYATDVVAAAILQVINIMMNDSDLKQKAKVNSEDDFRLAYQKALQKVMMKSYSQNKDFFNMLLKNPEKQNEVFGVFVHSMYKQLKEE